MVYIDMMGGEGLTYATKVAILNANYIAQRLEEHYPVLYKGANGRVAHECIVDPRAFKASARRRGGGHREAADGLRLPRADGVVPGGRHADDRADGERAEGGARPLLRRADRDPRGDPRDRDGGRWTATDNPLKHAPHTMRAVVSDAWSHAYGREQAAFPAPWTRERKFWPAVARVESAYGDRQPGVLVPADGRVCGGQR